MIEKIKQEDEAGPRPKNASIKTNNKTVAKYTNAVVPAMLGTVSFLEEPR